MKNKHFFAVFTLLVFSFSSFAFSQVHLGDDLLALTADVPKISLDLKGMDIIEVLKTLATKGKMNIVVGANVRGRVTMFLKNVDITDAFEIILAANNLAADRRGEIVYVMTQRDYQQTYGKDYGDKKEVRILELKYAKAADINKALNQIKTKIGKVIVDEGSNTIVVIDTPDAISQAAELVEKLDKPTTTVVFELNYANAADLKDKIEEVLTKGVGSVEIDERTNKILVTDLKNRMDEIKQIIGEFDSKSQQVLIEAKIVEITLTDEYKLGIDWQAVLADLQKQLQPLVKNPITVTSAFKLATAGALIPGGELLIGDFNGSDYGIMLQALKTVGDVNTLSSPRITVLNNEEAKILIGTSEPYAINTVTQSGDLATTGTELQFLDIGVKLFVTPTINRNGFVTMKIKPEVSNSTENYTYGDPPTSVPIVSTTQAETSVVVKDGYTIIIAGLIKDDRSDSTNKVPYLGDIPVIGLIFKNTDQRVQKKELVIFITPHIISGEVDYLDVPEKPPINEKRFTMPAEPAFYRRRPVKMSPGYLYERDEKSENLYDSMFKKKKEPAPVKPVERATVEERASTPEDYYSIVKNKILGRLDLAKDDSRISVGDRAKVYFRLYSGGNLAAKPKITESSNYYLSQEIINAVEESAPFPPFPMTIREFKKDFSLDIVYDP